MVSDMKKIFSFYKSIQNIESLDIKFETLVRGVAGSGKTTIAINRALRIVRDNENNMFGENIKVAYVVFNGVLALRQCLHVISKYNKFYPFTYLNILI